jgi:hypothetical protein
MTVHHTPSGAHSKSIEFHKTVLLLDMNSGDGWIVSGHAQHIQYKTKAATYVVLNWS